MLNTNEVIHIITFKSPVHPKKIEFKSLVKHQFDDQSEAKKLYVPKLMIESFECLMKDIGDFLFGQEKNAAWLVKKVKDVCLYCIMVKKQSHKTNVLHFAFLLALSASQDKQLHDHHS